MRKNEEYTGFEQGPIRPPSEAESLLVRITRNCPWNRCTFCPVYKGAQFSLRPVDHVLMDIDVVRHYVDLIEQAAKDGSAVSRLELKTLIAAEGQRDKQAFHAAYNFAAGGMKSIFLQDGNSLIIKPEDLIRILEHLKEAFPKIERITSYARSQTVARISGENLEHMAQAGLNRIHIGLESGSDTVLERVRKGVDKATHITAGKKVKRAGMELSEYYMPGLGGAALAEENARETADALNRINPDFIRLRTLALPAGVPLTEQYLAGDFDKMGEVDTAAELLLFLRSLGDITSTVRSDHVLNLFPEVDGKLPGDREKIIKPVQEFLELDREEQTVFCIGRRTHRLSRLRDMQDPELRANAENICSVLGATPGNMDSIISSIMQRFI